MPGMLGDFSDVSRIQLRYVLGNGIQYWYAVTLPDEEPLPVDGQLYWLDSGALWARIFLAFGWPWNWVQWLRDEH